MPEAKTIIITGVTSGLGLALARHYLKEDHRVFGCGRRDHPQRDNERANLTFAQLDILDRPAVFQWAEEIQAQHPIDILVHNAGVIHPNANFCEIQQEQLDAVIDINIKGTYNVLQAFLPRMIEARRGVIVNMSSGSGRYGIPSLSAYCASKFAVEGLTKALAKELPEPMAAIPLAPGMIDTAMLRGNASVNAELHQKPQDWAMRAGPMILNLSRQHNGQSLEVPGPA